MTEQKKLTIYVASSWRNYHAVELLTAQLEQRGHTVRSFVRNNGDLRCPEVGFNLDDWIASSDGEAKFAYDTRNATTADLVIYVGPAGTDAWAEVGAAWASGIPVWGLWTKAEPAGLMRRMVKWYTDVFVLLDSLFFVTARDEEETEA